MTGSKVLATHKKVNFSHCSIIKLPLAKTFLIYIYESPIASHAYAQAVWSGHGLFTYNILQDPISVSINCNFIQHSRYANVGIILFILQCSTKTYAVTPYKNCLMEFLMKYHNVCFYADRNYLMTILKTLGSEL